MQLRHLNTFVAIVESGTLTAAADRLFKTQGAVSHDLRSLERELGVELIDRSGQRVRLTAAGEVLLPHAYELLQRVRDVESTMAGVRRGESGVVRVGTLPSTASSLLQLIVDYHGVDPDCRFILMDEPPYVLLDSLREGRLDILLAEPQLDDQLLSTALGTELLFVVVAATDPLARMREVRPSDVLEKPFIGFCRDFGSGQKAEEFFRAVGRYPAPLVEVQNYRLMKDLIRRGLGFGVMPASTVDGETDLVAIRTNPRLERRLVAIRRTSRQLPPAILRFYDYLCECWQPSAAVVRLPEREGTAA